MSSPAVTPDTDLDMKDVELNELETEKQPMNASPASGDSPGEKNGAVMVKVGEEEGRGGAASAKFTGLSKEELLEVASTPAWVRTRWALLLLFWLGWLGMLAGAIAIIVQAPRCKDLPKQTWWQKGGLYRVNVDRFQDSDADGTGDLAGLKQRIDYISSLKVKGLVVGPVHVNPKDEQNGTNLQEIDPVYGTREDLREVLQAAKKKSLKVILDLTPNYRSNNPWFDQSNGDLWDEMKAAMEFWLKEGVWGFQLTAVEAIKDPQILSDLKANLTGPHGSDDQGRALIAVTQMRDPQGIFALLNETAGADVLASDYLLGALEGPGEATRGQRTARLIGDYVREAGSKWAGWSVARTGVGPLALSFGEHILRLYHMLLYTLPGTPFTDYGDEIGLRDLPGRAQSGPSEPNYMQWDGTANFGFSKKSLPPIQATGSNVTVQLQSGNKDSVLSFFQQLSELRGKERSLLHGDYSEAGSSDPRVFAYLRVWDQNKRFLLVLNLAPHEATVSLAHPDLPADAAVELSTDPGREKKTLALQGLTLSPYEGLVLTFLYVA